MKSMECAYVVIMYQESMNKSVKNSMLAEHHLLLQIFLSFPFWDSYPNDVLWSIDEINSEKLGYYRDILSKYQNQDQLTKDRFQYISTELKR